jgi:epoxyqueuosine reductase
MKKPGHIDTRVSRLKQELCQGKITRREFLRSMALLGLSLGMSEILTACSTQETSEATSRFLPWRTDIDNNLATEPYETLVVPTFTPIPDVPVIKKTPTPIPQKQITWLCAACGERFRTRDEFTKHAASEHSWRLPEIIRVEHPTYSEFLKEPVTRFDERNTVFSRTLWDSEYMSLVKEAATKASQDNLKALEGRALVAGAIYVDNTAGALHPNYGGYMGHVRNDNGLYGWDDPINSEQFPVSDPAWMSERIKTVARFYGANLVGITEVDPRWIYSHYFERSSGDYGNLEIPYRYAIVMGIEMNWKWINESPDAEASAATALAYSQMAELSASLAKYIRALGYAAIPCGNDTAQSIPLAIDAGLGELGRNGLLISPEYGPRQRICKVFTDLPLQTDQPIDFGMRSFCETCHACAAACPANAIRWEARTTEQTSISNRPGILRWPVNVTACYLFWTENGFDCSNCVAACPWALHSQRDWLEL